MAKVQFMINCCLSPPSFDAYAWSATAKAYVKDYFKFLETKRSAKIGEYFRLERGDRDHEFFLRSNAALFYSFFRLLFVLMGRHPNEPLNVTRVKAILRQDCEKVE